MTHIRNSHRSRGGRLRSAVALWAMLGAGYVASGCQSMLSLSRRSDVPSPADQTRIGLLAWQEWSHAHEPARDERQLEVVRRVGQRLATASGRTDLQWQFDVVVDPTPQVVAFPGGHVAVSDALLAQCENEGVLAAAMSHEMGHMLAGHSLERLRDHNTGPAPGNSQTLPYDARQEVESDSIALSLMVRAGYDPDAAHTFWTRTAAEQASPQYNGLARLHAVDRQRLAQLETSLAQARTMYRSVPQPLGVGEALAFEVHHDPPPGPTPPATRIPARTSPAPIAPSLWTATTNHGATKPDSWNSDLKSTDSAAFTAHHAGPALPPERPVRQAAFEAPDDDEWLTPVLRSAE